MEESQRHHCGAEKDKMDQFAEEVRTVMLQQQNLFDQQHDLFEQVQQQMGIQHAATLRWQKEDIRQRDIEKADQVAALLHQLQRSLDLQATSPRPPRLPELPVLKWEHRSHYKNYQQWEMKLRRKIQFDCSIGYTPAQQILYALFRMDEAASELIMPWLQVHVLDRTFVAVTFSEFISYMRVVFGRYQSPDPEIAEALYGFH